MKFINNFKLLLIFGACIFVLKPLDAKAYTYHTQAEAVKWANDQVGKGIDYDGIYGNQCVDLIKAYYKYLAGVDVKPQIISGDLSRLFKAETPVIVCGQ